MIQMNDINGKVYDSFFAITCTHLFQVKSKSLMKPCRYTLPCSLAEKGAVSNLVTDAVNIGFIENIGRVNTRTTTLVTLSEEEDAMAPL